MKKQNCIDCNKETTNGIFILTGKDWKYEYYCLNCSRAFLGKFCKKSLLKVNRIDLNGLSKQYDILLQQSINGMIKDGFERDNIPFEYKKYLLKRTDILNDVPKKAEGKGK